jgi:hypothetical protein
MKIVVAVRTRNEEINIARFCRGYQWADKILVADGGSEDGTKFIASKFPNVKIRNFRDQVVMDNDIKRNPHAAHLNFMIDWAFVKEKADWIIMDDADCFPNIHLKNNAPSVMRKTRQSYIYVTRLYLWKDEGHFPDLAKPNESKTYVPSLWAWHKRSLLTFMDTGVKSHQQLAFTPKDKDILKLMPPYALLHCPWQTDEMVQKKLNFYRNSGEVPDMKHPLEFGGAIEPLPNWAVE